MNLVLNLEKTRCFLIVFFCTLQSIYFYNISLAPFPILSLLLLFHFDSKFFKSDLLISLLLIIIVIINLLFLPLFIKEGTIYFQTILGFFIGIVYFLFLQSYLKKNKLSTIIFAINLSLSVHISFFLIQFIYFLVTGDHLDFIVGITGEVTRNINNLSIIRSSGLFIEPQNYSFFILALIFLKYHLSPNYYDSISLISLLTVILSFSLFGIIGAIVFYFLIFRKVVSKWLIIPILVVGFYYTYDYYFFIYETRITSLSDDGSFLARFSEPFFKLFTEINYLLLGKGFGVIGTDFSELSTLLSILTSFGLFFGSFFIFIIFNSLNFRVGINKYYSLFLFAFILLMDLRISMVFFWLLFGLSYFKYFNNEKIYN
tara:strand:- start:13498 stop:14613 length:1116 start_codon:yes stop_codon:yes gene_type:complete